MIEVYVSRKQQEAVDIVSLELVRTDAELLPAFTAGAHVDIHLPGKMIRQYSLCGELDNLFSYKVAILRDPASRGGSVALHDSVREGDRLMISAPRNLFELVPGASNSILLAGGIGVTPILTMAEQLAAEGADFMMHYCARSEARMAFQRKLSEAPYAQHIKFHLDDGAPSQRLDLANELPAPSAGTHLYVCGPTGFIDHVLSVAQECGWPSSQLHREYFSADGATLEPAEEFQVKIASTGDVFSIPEDRSIVDVLYDQGFDIPVSCEEGMCGSCVTTLLAVDGSVQHNDMYLSESQHAEGRLFTPCCSRATAGSLLTLDL